MRAQEAKAAAVLLLATATSEAATAGRSRCPVPLPVAGCAVAIPVMCVEAEAASVVKDGEWISAAMPSDEAAVRGVLEALADPVAEVRAAACAALGDMAAMAAPGGRGSEDEVVGEWNALAGGSHAFVCDAGVGWWGDDGRSYGRRLSRAGEVLTARGAGGTLTQLAVRTRGHPEVVERCRRVMVEDESAAVRREAVVAVGRVAACGDAGARASAEEAMLGDVDWRVREAAAVVVHKLARVGERRAVQEEMEWRAREREGAARLAAGAQKRELTALLVRNLDLEVARRRTFDVAWQVDAGGGAAVAWPAQRFAAAEGSGSGSEEEDGQALNADGLAWAGFFFAPQAGEDDRAECFCCGAARSGWAVRDDPLRWHAGGCLFQQCAAAQAGARVFPVPPPSEAQLREAPGGGWRVRGEAALEAALGARRVAEQARGLDVLLAELRCQRAGAEAARQQALALEAEARSAAGAAAAAVGDGEEDVAAQALAAFLSAMAEGGGETGGPGADEGERSVARGLVHGGKRERGAAAGQVVRGVRAGRRGLWAAAVEETQGAGAMRRQAVLHALADAAR